MAVVAFVAPLDPTCWIKVCSEETKLPSYWLADPVGVVALEPLAAVVAPAAAVDCAPVAAVALVPLPKPSAFSACMSECRKV